MNQVGIIGVGLLGTAIAERLLSAGYLVTGFDPRAEQLDRLRTLGGEAAASPSRVASSCRRLILSLPTSAIAGEVLTEIAGGLAAGSVVIDTTTGAPEDAAGFSQRLNRMGTHYLDATVGGSSRQVRNREAIFLCGGAQHAFEECSDIFEQCCHRAYYMGPAGSGARMKLVMNLVLGLNRAVLAEGLEFARASGIDPYLALEILKAGPAYSRAMDLKGARMLNEEFEPEARLSQHLKDVRLILASGTESGASLPLSEIHERLLEDAEQAGFGPSDNSAVIKAFQHGRLKNGARS